MRSSAPWYCIATFSSAFLVFQVQPVMSRAILPWFGGSPSVWTSCMLFFQLLLFAGYLYAHLTRKLLSPRGQGWVHFALIAAALAVLPITPGDQWKPRGDELPATHLLMILLANVGLPYFLLASTAPLTQAWFSDENRDRSPYRLYSLSNLGSLAALLTYPFLVEPYLSTTWQGRVWSLGFCLFAVVCGYLAIAHVRADRTPGTGRCPEPTEAPGRRPRSVQCAGWLLLPALASTMLLATTNHVCQDVAVVPLLWIAPLSLYLSTFIICFDHERWYSRRWHGGLAVVSIGLLTFLLHHEMQWNLTLEIVAYLTAMFLVCMVCHGELVRSKPAPRYLTNFYLLSSAGGALGGVLVAIVCPLIFDRYLEMNLSLLSGLILALLVFLTEAAQTWWGDDPKRRSIAAMGYFAVLLFVGSVQLDHMSIASASCSRSFYGVLQIEDDRQRGGTRLVHGRTDHGFQFRDAVRRRQPTAYYASESGVGRALDALGASKPLRVGVVGLGCGTLAAYGRPGDSYRFYELNPHVAALAYNEFTYLDDSSADCEVVLGDARLSLEREPSQCFDLLVLDAFSSDSIPAHLLTREAFRVYEYHLRPGGVIAVHISNRHLRLDGVLARLAAACHMRYSLVTNSEHRSTAVMAARWMLLTRDAAFLDNDQIQRAASHQVDGDHAPLWTDQNHDLFQILDVF